MWLIGSLTLWDYILLVSMCVFAYWYWRRRQAVTPAELHRPPSAPRLPPMRKQDMSIEQLRNFNGSETAGGRILVACDGKIFDVSRARHLYGQDGPYGLFAGRDASRCLATFSMHESVLKEGHDDLSDLSLSEIESMKEWAGQFEEKYPIVGRLLKPGEQPDVYTDSEDETGTESSSKRDSSIDSSSTALDKSKNA